MGAQQSGPHPLNMVIMVPTQQQPPNSFGKREREAPFKRPGWAELCWWETSKDVWNRVIPDPRAPWTGVSSVWFRICRPRVVP